MRKRIHHQILTRYKPTYFVMRKKIQLSLCGVLLFAGTALAQGGFHHPGLLHSAADFEAVKERIASGETLANEALQALRTAPPVNGDHGHNWGANEYITRGISGQENYMNAYRNAARAYQCALAWKITGETWYADVAVDVLNAYRVYNKGLGGNTNISLIPGFIGYQFANAAELMRDYRSAVWGEEEFELFKQYMIDVWFTVAQDFLERRHDTVAREGNWYHYHSNWGLGNALFCVSLGILCDLPDIYNYGMYWIKEGPGNESLCVALEHPDPYTGSLCGYGWGLIPWFHADDRGPLGYLNQMQESGRDQGHSMAALGLLSYALESAYNQGDNAFCNLNNSLVPGLAGSAMVAGAAEYVAAYNAGHDDLPYTQNWWMAGLNGTGRGQHRPIWQLFINHYQNKMGIPMKYCSEMKAIVGLERGGGSYGTNSGGYDHTGFGDLMYWDEPVAADEMPTILFPQIASPTEETRNYAEISQVESGTVLTLAVKLPEGETDTGNWRWEDGATGSQRQITADHSGIYRVTYTNSNGVESTQMFSIAVRGEGIQGTLVATVTCNGLVTDGSQPVEIGDDNKAFFTTAYANWNYIESEKWYLDGQEVATGGTYAYTQSDEADHTLVFRLTNQSGVAIERTFQIAYDAEDITGLLPDPACENLSAWAVDIQGFQTQPGIASYQGFNPLFIERFREPNQDGVPCWGLGRFNISQTVDGLKPGKYEVGAFLMATQQSLTGSESKNYVKDVWFYAGGQPVAVATENNVPERFTVTAYVGEDGTLTFGIKNLTDQDYARSANGMNWFAMDNFTLAYKGLDDLSADVAAMRQQAEDVAEDEVTPVIYEGLRAWLSEGASDIDGAVTGQYWLAEAELVKRHYKEYQEQCKLYRTSVETTPDEALEQALDDFSAAGMSAEFYTAWETLEDVWNAYVVEHGMGRLDQAESILDVTSLLENAGLEMPSSTMQDGNMGWKTDAEGGNYRVCAVPVENRGTAQGTNMVERFGWTFADGVRLVYQSLEGLSAGRYVFQASAFKDIPNGDIRLFANGSEQAVYAVDGMQPFSVSALVEDGQLAVGLKQGLLNNCYWAAMTDIRLMYYSPLVLLDEALAQAGALDYGTDSDGKLADAVASAQAARTDEVATEKRMVAYKELLEAMDAYRLANASMEHPVDVTGRIANAGFDGNTTDGWTCSVLPGSVRQGVAEFWHTPFDICQTLTGLPAGYYRVGLQARYNVDANAMPFNLYAETADGGRTEAAVDFAAPVEGNPANGAGLAQQANAFEEEPDGSFTFAGPIAVSDGQLILGAATGSDGLWCVLGGFTLEYLGTVTMELDENAMEYAVAEDTEVQQVTVARKLKADGRWNTFCVPFDMTAGQLAANHITDVERLAGAETSGTSVTLNFEEAAMVEAGVPYLVRVSEAVEVISVDGVTVEAASPETHAISVDGVTMTGNYAATTVPQGAYFISDNAFYLADVADAVSLKGFRAYITLGGVAQANRLLVNVDGEVTAVDDALQAEEADPLVDVYSMDGLRLKRGVRKSAALEGLPRGIYVVGGEKVGR